MRDVKTVDKKRARALPCIGRILTRAVAEVGYVSCSRKCGIFHTAFFVPSSSCFILLCFLYSTIIILLCNCTNICAVVLVRGVFVFMCSGCDESGDDQFSLVSDKRAKRKRNPPQLTIALVMVLVLTSVRLRPQKFPVFPNSRRLSSQTIEIILKSWPPSDLSCL